MTVGVSDGKLDFTWAAGEIPAPRRRETMNDERIARPSRPRLSASSVPTVMGSGASD